MNVSITDNEGRALTQNKGTTLLFSLAHMVNDLYPNLYQVLIPSLMVVLHFSVAQAGAIATVIALSTQLTQPFMGIWADRVGGSWFITGGLAFGAVLSCAALGFAPSYAVLVIMLFLGGFGNSAFHPQAFRVVGDMSGERKGFGMSMFLIGGNIGMGIAPLIAMFAFLHWGRPGLILLSLPGIILAVALYAYRRNIPTEADGNWSDLIAAFKEKWGKLLSLLAIVGIRYMVASAVLIFLPIWWQMRYGQMTHAATLLCVMLLGATLGSVLGGYLTDTIGTNPVIVASSLLSSLLVWALLNSSGVWLWVIIGILGAAIFFTNSTTMVIGQAMFPRQKGMVSGIVLGVGNTIGSIGVGLLGVYAEHAGVAGALFLLIFISLLSAPFVFCFPRRLFFNGTPDHVSDVDID